MADAEDKIYQGGCLCGAVRYAARGLSDIWYCHCTQCRALMGHYMAAAGVPRDDLDIAGEIAWTRVSPHAEFGFCASCSSPLFWRHDEQTTVSVVAASIADTDGIEVKGHIFVAEKGSYYDITDDLPQYERYPEGSLRQAGTDA